VRCRCAFACCYSSLVAARVALSRMRRGRAHRAGGIMIGGGV